MFLYLQISATGVTFLQVIFATFLEVLRHFWQYVEFKDIIQKSLCQSRKRISVTTFIKSFIAAHDSAAQDLAARIHQK